MGGIPSVQATDPVVSGNTTNTSLIERGTHTPLLEELRFLRTQEGVPCGSVPFMVLPHGFLQYMGSIDSLLQSRNPAGGLQSVNLQAQLGTDQPIEGWEGFFIHHGCDANHNRFTVGIGNSDRTQTAGLPTQKRCDTFPLVGRRRGLDI